jgi:hypothetical protein
VTLVPLAVALPAGVLWVQCPGVVCRVTPGSDGAASDKTQSLQSETIAKIYHTAFCANIIFKFKLVFLAYTKGIVRDAAEYNFMVLMKSL